VPGSLITVADQLSWPAALICVLLKRRGAAPGALSAHAVEQEVTLRRLYLGQRCGASRCPREYFDVPLHVPTAEWRGPWKPMSRALPCSGATTTQSTHEAFCRPVSAPVVEARGQSLHFSTTSSLQRRLFFGREQEIPAVAAQVLSGRPACPARRIGTADLPDPRRASSRGSPRALYPVYVRALQEPPRAIKKALCSRPGWTIAPSICLCERAWMRPPYT